MKSLIFGFEGANSLESSYKRAFNDLGHDCLIFDLNKSISKLPFLPKKLFYHVYFDHFVKVINRAFVIKCKEFQPDLIIQSGVMPLQAGSIATIKCLLPNIKIVWLWPDTPLNLKNDSILAAPLYDLCACYSSVAAGLLSKLGFNNVHWIPLAADPELHDPGTSELQYTCDLSFVGAWRPERQAVLEIIFQLFPNLQLQIHGPTWKKQLRYSNLLRFHQSEGLFGKDLAKMFASSRINLNVIDDTNYPAANMRFFEVQVAGGLQLCTTCPEMETEFAPNNRVYFTDASENSLNNQINQMLTLPDPQKRLKAAASRQYILEHHTYKNRLQKIINSL